MKEENKKIMEEIHLQQLINYLAQDVGMQDITAQLVPEGECTAEVVAKQDGILSGLEEALLLARHFGIHAESKFKDGMKFKKGDVIVTFTGENRKILTLERVVLNILMRMSGIATLTRRAVDIAGKYGVKIACTRKLTPGFGYFEKKAVKAGGGLTHRLHLDDLFLIKDNHLALADLREMVSKAKQDFTKKVEVEVSSIQEALEACKAGADIVMLDNFTVEEASHAILVLRQNYPEVIIELSGGITLENLREYVELKPDVISMGMLTTSSAWVDMSLRVKGKRLNINGEVITNKKEA